MRFAAHGVIEVLPLQPCHVLVFNFSANAMLLPKHTVVLYDSEAPTSVMTALTTSPHHSTKETKKCVDSNANSEVTSLLARQQNLRLIAKSNIQSKQWRATCISLRLQSIINQQLTECRKFGNTRASRATQQNSSLKTKNGIAVSAQYQAYKQYFIYMLSQFKVM